MKIIKKTNKKNLVVAVILLLLAGGAAGVWYYFTNYSNSAPETEINYNPPTNDEITEGDLQKERNREREAIEKTQPVVERANVYIVDANQYDDVIEVRGYIDNVYEEGGRCVAVFTKGDLTFERSSEAFKDAKSIQCGALDVPRDAFKESGVWQLVLKYKSSKYTGEANASINIK